MLKSINVMNAAEKSRVPWWCVRGVGAQAPGGRGEPSPLPQSFGGPCWRDPHMDFTGIASRQAFEGSPWKRRHTNATVRQQEEERVL